MSPTVSTKTIKRKKTAKAVPSVPSEDVGERAGRIHRKPLSVGTPGAVVKRAQRGRPGTANAPAPTESQIDWVSNLIGSAAASELAAAGKLKASSLVSIMQSAGVNDVDFTLDGVPVKLKFVSPTGREITATERVAAASARVFADEKRGEKTPEWIVDLSEQTPH